MKKRIPKRRTSSVSGRSRSAGERVLVFLFAFFVFSMPLFIWPGVTEYGYGKSIFALIGISLLVILWGVLSWLRGEWQLRLPWLSFPLLGLVLICLFSLLGATNGRVVIQSLTLLIFFSLFALLIAQLVKEKRDVNLILFSLLLSAFFAALYGLLQYLGVMRGAFGGKGLGEIISTMGNRNYLGGFLAYLVFPSIVLIIRPRFWLLRVMAIGLLSFNVAMLLLLQQAGTQVSLAAGLAVLALGMGLWPVRSPVRRRWPWLIGAGGLFLVGVGVVLGPAMMGIALLVVGALAAAGYGLGWALRRWRWAWVVSLVAGLLVLLLLIPPTTPFAAVKQVWERNSGAVRSWDWWVGWEMFRDHPLVGVGLGNYKLNFIPYKAAFLASPQGAGYNFYIDRAAQAHNEYVQVMAELGSLGILAGLALLVVIPIAFWQRLAGNREEGDRLDLILFGCGVVVFLVHAVVSFPAHLPSSSLVLVVLLGLAFSRAYGEAAVVRALLRGWPHKAIVALLTAFCLTVSVFAARDYSADRLLNRGIRQLQMGQLQLAEATFEESIRRDFCPRQVYYHLATVRIKQGRYEEARADLERCLTRFVVEQVYLNLANLALNLGDIETARESLGLLLASHPHPDVRIQAEFLTGVIAIRTGDYERAIDELEALVEAHPDFERSYVVLGDLFRARGMPVTARRYYERALSIIEPRLSRAKSRLTSLTALPADQYARLRSEIEQLTQEREAVEAGLARLPPP